MAPSAKANDGAGRERRAGPDLGHPSRPAESGAATRDPAFDAVARPLACVMDFFGLYLDCCGQGARDRMCRVLRQRLGGAAIGAEIAGHGHRAKKSLVARRAPGRPERRLDGSRGIAERFQPLDNRHGVGVLPSQRHQDPARGELDPCRRHLGQLVERPLDRGDALAAADLRRRERQP